LYNNRVVCDDHFCKENVAMTNLGHIGHFED